MSVNFSFSAEDWRGMLDSVLPSVPSEGKPQEPHSWICEVQRPEEESHLEVLSHEEYTNFFKTNSRWNSRVRKLPFKELISVSNYFISPDRFVQQVQEIINFVNRKDVFNTDAKDEFTGMIEAIESSPNTLQVIHTDLKTIYTISKKKREDDYNVSLWGKIKWFVWSTFFDQGAEIGKLRPVLGGPKTQIKLLIDQLRSRLIYNMVFFEDIKDAPEQAVINLKDVGVSLACNEKIENYLNEYTSPNVVKKWFLQYAADKFEIQQNRTLNPKAADFRTRVDVLRQIWAAVNSLSQASPPSSSKGDQSRPTPRPTPLLGQ